MIMPTVEELSPEPSIDCCAPPPAISEKLLTEKAILVHLALSQIGRTRLVREGAATLAKEKDKSGDEGENGELEAVKLEAVNTDKNLVKVTKTLFECAELKHIQKCDDEVRTFIARKCLPSPMRAKSVYLIPLGLVEEVDARLHYYQTERAQLVAAFVKVYPRLLVKARRSLRDLFDRHDYPRRDAVTSCFNMEWQFVALGVPDALGEISREIFAREREKSALKWQKAEEEIQQLLRVRLKQMLENLSERLRPDASGKQKVFRNTLVGNIQDFMADFNALNITNDQELADIVSNVSELLKGVHPQTLRDSQNVRDVVIEGAKSLENQLTTLIVDKPKRLISFDD